MKTLIIKSLLTSLYQREGINPSLVKRGMGRFSNNDALLMRALVYPGFSSSVSVISEIRRGGVKKLTSPLFFR